MQTKNKNDLITELRGDSLERWDRAPRRGGRACGVVTLLRRLGRCVSWVIRRHTPDELACARDDVGGNETTVCTGFVEL